MSVFNDWLSEDEDDIFMGSPKSKFFDVSRTASEDIVEDEVEDAAMETLYGLDDVSYEESVEEDFLNESITEEIMASSIGSSLECSSPQKQ